MPVIIGNWRHSKCVLLIDWLIDCVSEWKYQRLLVEQAFGVVRFLFHYALPVTVFVFCYGSIFHTIRRQSKVVGGHARYGHDVPMATTSRDPNAGQVQQQVTGATTGDRLSRTELSVLKTMVVVIICFILFWSVPAVSNLMWSLGVSVLLTNVIYIYAYYRNSLFTVLLSPVSL